jgi:hypothetical protein
MAGQGLVPGTEARAVASLRSNRTSRIIVKAAAA